MIRRLFVLAAIGTVFSSACLAQSSSVPPAERKLVDLITRKQQENVRRSTGTFDYQCFTDVNLETFKSSNRPKKIVEALKTDPQFKALVDEIRALSEPVRKEVLAHARKICQPTWAEMGYIDKEGNGQTEAGQQAQLLISAAIVEAVQSLLQAR